MTTTNPLFDGIEQTHLTFAGHDTVVPLRYHCGTAMFGVFAARSRALSQKAPHPSLRPATIAPGIAPVVVIGFEFVTDIRAVNELCIAVPLRRSRLAIPLAALAAGALSESMPTWIWHLPVSTEIANILGRQMWGFPKIHADIPITQDADGHRTTHLSENGCPILTLHGPALNGSHALRLPPDDVLISRRSIAYGHARSLQALLGMPKHLTPGLLDRYRRAAEEHDLAAVS